MSILSELKKLTGKQNAKVVSEALPDSIGGGSNEKYDFEITFTATENEDGDLVVSSDTPPASHAAMCETGRAKVFYRERLQDGSFELSFSGVFHYTDLMDFGKDGPVIYSGTKYSMVDMNSFVIGYDSDDDATPSQLSAQSYTIIYPKHGEITVQQSRISIPIE